jgi:hypothetical protein
MKVDDFKYQRGMLKCRYTLGKKLATAMNTNNSGTTEINYINADLNTEDNRMLHYHYQK